MSSVALQSFYKSTVNIDESVKSQTKSWWHTNIPRRGPWFNLSSAEITLGESETLQWEEYKKPAYLLRANAYNAVECICDNLSQLLEDVTYCWDTFSFVLLRIYSYARNIYTNEIHK